MITKTHRTTVYASFRFEAYFFAYYNDGKLVNLQLDGEDIAIHGEVSKEVFYAEMRKIFKREGREGEEVRELYESCRALTFSKKGGDANAHIAHARLNRMIKRF